MSLPSRGFQSEQYFPDRRPRHGFDPDRGKTHILAGQVACSSRSCCVDWRQTCCPPPHDTPCKSQCPHRGKNRRCWIQKPAHCYCLLLFSPDLLSRFFLGERLHLNPSFDFERFHSGNLPAAQVGSQAAGLSQGLSAGERIVTRPFRGLRHPGYRFLSDFPCQGLQQTEDRPYFVPPASNPNFAFAAACAAARRAVRTRNGEHET